MVNSGNWIETQEWPSQTYPLHIWEHTHTIVVDHLVEQGWTKPVLFAQENRLHPTTFLSLSHTCKDKQKNTCVGPAGCMVGPELRPYRQTSCSPSRFRNVQGREQTPACRSQRPLYPCKTWLLNFSYLSSVVWKPFGSKRFIVRNQLTTTA